MKILLTGAGLLGAHAARKLKSEGHTCVLADSADVATYLSVVVGLGTPLASVDITRPDEVDNLLATYKPDAVVHTAGVMGALFEKDLEAGRRLVVDSTARLAKQAIAHGTTQLVFASSLAVYDFGDPDRIITEDSPKETSDQYGLAKLAAEEALIELAEKSGLIVSILRLSGLYGYGPGLGGAWMGNYLNSVLSKLLLEDDEPIILEVGRLGWNEYLHASDAANAISLALQLSASITCNVGAGQIYSPLDILAALQELFPKRLIEVSSGTTVLPISRLRQNPMDIRLAQNALGWRPVCVYLRDGLAETVRTMREATKTSCSMNRPT